MDFSKMILRRKTVRIRERLSTMKNMRVCPIAVYLAAALTALVPATDRAPAQSDEPPKQSAQVKREDTANPDFPKGTGTPSVECGVCHQAIYREYAFGFGTDMVYKPTASQSVKDGLLSLKEQVFTMGAAHSIS